MVRTGMVLMLGWLMVSGCGAAQNEHGNGNGDDAAPADWPKVTKAVCVLHPTEGNDVRGTVTFTQDGDQVHVVAEITGLTPGDHGFHIHELGDCTSADGSSAGGHFAPDMKEHGAPDADMRHAGDLGNITADESGRATLDWRDPVIRLNGPHSIIGRGMIVHEKADDLRTQPTGAAGGRLACGVIGIAALEQ